MPRMTPKMPGVWTQIHCSLHHSSIRIDKKTGTFHILEQHRLAARFPGLVLS